MQRAGDDSGRQKSEIQRPKAWNLLSKEWKALAFLAVNQSAPDSIDPNSADGRASRPNRRIGRRGGRGGRGQKVTDGYNGGGGTVLLVTGTKPLPSSLTLAAAAGTGGSSIASAGTVVTVFNINASDTDPGA